MPVNPRSSARMNEFLGELSRINLKAFHHSRSVYSLNGQKVSIRTTTKPGPKYWYDISESILNGVEYLIYQTNSRHHFVLFPFKYFNHCYSSLKDSNRPNAKQFYIHWNHKTIVSTPDYEEDIKIYCCSTLPNESSGNWKEVFQAE